MTVGPEAWIGRRRESLDKLDSGRAAALANALGQTSSFSDGDLLPQLFHWLYFWDVPTPEATGADGHSVTGDFLPAAPGARRMWAGSRLTFHSGLRLGDPVRRVSTIDNVVSKEGRSGPLMFVTVKHQLHGPGGLAILEEQDLVYREAAAANAVAPAGVDGAPLDQGDWSQQVRPDPVLLFRYSALTMNSHRIHYDRPYAMKTEGYADLVVHGPLQATLMLHAATARAGLAASQFSFRALAPAFCGRELAVHGRDGGATAQVWADQTGVRTMEGLVDFGGPR